MTQSFSERVDKIPPSGIRRFFDLVSEADNVISLGVGEPDFMTPWQIRHEAIQSIVSGDTNYTSNRGTLDCRDAIAAYMKKRFRSSYDPNHEILVTVGVSEGLDAAFRAVLNPGDEVIVPEPCFVCYGPLVTLAGGDVVPLDTSTTALIPDPEKIEAMVSEKTKVLLLCSPSNPTGRVIPKDTLKAILKLAKKYDFWIFSDEIYGELVYDTVFTSLGSFPSARDRVVVFNGVSKAFSMTGWRLGFMCGPEPLISRALKVHQYAIMCASTMAQQATVKALDGSIEDEVEAMRKSYHERRDFFVGAMNGIGLKTLVPEGAFYCFPYIGSTGLTSEDFALQLLKKQQVAVIPGPVFGESGEGFIRCCYATSMEQLEESVKRIKAFVSQKK